MNYDFSLILKPQNNPFPLWPYLANIFQKGVASWEPAGIAIEGESGPPTADPTGPGEDLPGLPAAH